MKKLSSKTKAEIIVSACILGISALLYVDGKALSPISKDAMRFPGMAIFAIVILLALSWILPALQKAPKDADEDVQPLIKNKKNFLICLGMVVAYAALMYVIGFIAASILLIIGFGLIFKYQKLALLIVYSIIASAVLYVLFKIYLKIDLPAGLLFELFM